MERTTDRTAALRMFGMIRKEENNGIVFSGRPYR